MGLLSKAASISGQTKNQEQKATTARGLLAKAMQFSESQAPTGLLDKAERLEVSEESEVEEAEGSGLLQKARALSKDKKEGLLEKAEIIAERKEGLLEKVEVVEEVEGKEGVLERAWKAIEEESGRAKKPVRAKVTKGAEAPLKKKRKVSKAKPKEEIKKEKTPDKLARQYLKEKDVMALVGLFSQTTREMGHDMLLQLILKTATDL
ncbi:MAG: hypothetical protein JSV25_00280 [Spirochaetota bacterium]|nr:MAG: hypothetical protein JSV25_00280 [Spirochaetota bacterium]